MLRPWRSYFRKNLPAELLQKCVIRSICLLSSILNENIKIADDENYYKTPLTPIGVL